MNARDANGTVNASDLRTLRDSLSVGIAMASHHNRDSMLLVMEARRICLQAALDAQHHELMQVAVQEGHQHLRIWIRQRNPQVLHSEVATRNHNASSEAPHEVAAVLLEAFNGRLQRLLLYPLDQGGCEAWCRRDGTHAFCGRTSISRQQTFVHLNGRQRDGGCTIAHNRHTVLTAFLSDWKHQVLLQASTLLLGSQSIQSCCLGGVGP
mmetsp:Transcript_36897/g.86488  ORF Transcript_36897/g.86488 Transcript_36897/m.86488 type:complete len:209 (-) Transcript_36897:2320-2946(-)